MPNKNKPVLSLGTKADPNPHVCDNATGGSRCDVCFGPLTEAVDPPVSESTEPILVDTDEFVSIAGLASSGRDNLIAQLRAHREKHAVKEYVSPAPTARQMSQTEREMEAGRRAQARHEAQQASRPAPVRDPADGFTTKAFRPSDVVPDPLVPGTVGKDGTFIAGTRQFDPNLK